MAAILNASESMPKSASQQLRIATLERHPPSRAGKSEEAMYRELVRRSPEAGVAEKRVLIPAARLLVTQALGLIDYYRIELIDLTRLVVAAQCSNLELQHRGIRAADALHITTALAEGAELLITTDAELVRLDNVFENASGVPLRCVDTDHALSLLA